MHSCKRVIDHIVFFLAEIHGVDNVPFGVDLFLCQNLIGRFLDIVLIEFNAGHIKHDFAFCFFLRETVIDVVRIGGMDFAAAAAAGDIFD